MVPSYERVLGAQKSRRGKWPNSCGLLERILNEATNVIAVLLHIITGEPNPIPTESLAVFDDIKSEFLELGIDFPVTFRASVPSEPHLFWA